jgi:hypothetical protein
MEVIMKRFFVLFVVILAINQNIFADFGFFIEGGLGYNTDENVGLGFVTSSKGFYTGVGAGFVNGDTLKLSIGCNVDFLIQPEIGFVRGEEHYAVENLADNASLRIMPYLELSRSINRWLYAGFGIGYGYDSIYFGMRPQKYDTDYTSYQLISKSVSPTVFMRTYIPNSSFYFSLNYEFDIVCAGELKRLAGDPLADFTNIDGATDIKGVHHRARLVFGYILGFDDWW